MYSFLDLCRQRDLKRYLKSFSRYNIFHRCSAAIRVVIIHSANDKRAPRRFTVHADSVIFMCVKYMYTE